MSKSASLLPPPALAIPSCTGAAITSAFSADMKNGKVPSATSPATRSPAGATEAV